MKMKAFRKALARLIEGPATSVSPETELPDFLPGVSREPSRPDEGLQQMAGSEMRVASGPHQGRRVTGGLINVDPRGKTREQIEAEIIAQIEAMRKAAGFTRLGPVKPAEIAAVMEQIDAVLAQRRPGPINPHTGEILPLPDDITWSQYIAMRDRSARDGWVYCRIACHTDEDRCMFPFGIVREHFGVFWQSFWSCAQEAEVPHACLVHLKTGGGLGVFESLAMACDAAESLLAIRNIDWPAVDPENRESFGKITSQIEGAWEFIGARTAPWCIHEVLRDQNDIGPPMELYVREQEKPEGKLS